MPRSEGPADPRQYVRVSVDLPMHPKLAAIDDPAAGWAHVVAMCYCGGSLTDGVFPFSYVLRLAGVERSVGMALAMAKLWHLPGHDCDRCVQPKRGDAVIHDYLRHQRSAEEANDLTEKRRSAGRMGAHKRWHSEQPVANGMANGMASAMAKPMANAWQTDSRGEERREESGTGTYVANGRNARQPEPPNNEPAGPAEKILTDWIGTLTRKPQQTIVDQIGGHVANALRDGCDPGDVADALKVWQARNNLGPSVLPSLIHEHSNPQPPGNEVVPFRGRAVVRGSTSDDRFRQAIAAGEAVAAQLTAEGANP